MQLYRLPSLGKLGISNLGSREGKEFEALLELSGEKMNCGVSRMRGGGQSRVVVFPVPIQFQILVPFSLFFFFVSLGPKRGETLPAWIKS